MASDAHLRTLRAIGFNARRADGTIPEEESAMKSDDTKPAVLSAARLALDAFEAAPTGSTIQDDAAYDAARALGPVLAHLDALTAGEVPASLYGDLNWAAKSDGEARSREMVAAAYVRGRAAGRSEGEAERAQMADDLALVTRRCEEFSRETTKARGELSEFIREQKIERERTAATIALLQAEVAGAARLAAVLSAHWPDDLPAVEERRPVTVADVAGRVLLRMQEEQERLTAELAGAHDRAIVFGRNVVASTERAMQVQIDAMAAELAEARAAAERWKLACERQEQANASADREDDKRVEAARVEGARVERREWSALLTIVDRITFDAPDDKPNGPGEQAIDDMSKALEVDRWPSNVRSRIADLNGHMATLCDALADDCHDLKAAADALRARGEDRPPCPGAGWEWDAFALQWFQPGAKGKAIAVPNRDRGAGGAG